MPSWIAPITWTFKQIPTFTNLNTEIRDKLLFFKTLFDDSANLAPPARTTLTLATDACTPTQNAHAVDTEAAAATDNLSTLTIAGNIRAGHVLILSAANVAHVVTVKDGVGNISLLGGDCVLGTTKAFLLLQLVGTTWFEITRSLIAPLAQPIATYTPTLANVLNTVTKTAVVSCTVPASDLTDGSVVTIQVASLVKNNKGTSGTVLFGISYAGVADVSPAESAVTWLNDASEYQAIWRFTLQRVGADLWLNVLSFNSAGTAASLALLPDSFFTETPAAGSAGSFGNGNARKIVAPSFTANQTLALNITLSAADATFYVKPQSALIKRVRL